MKVNLPILDAGCHEKLVRDLQTADSNPELLLHPQLYWLLTLKQKEEEKRKKKEKKALDIDVRA